MNAHAQQPIQSLEAEQVILGAAMMHAGLMPRLMDALAAEDFAEPVHQNIFTVCCDLAAQGRVVTPIVVAPMLPGDELAPGMRTQAYLARLCAQSPGPLVALDCARIVREKSRRRRLVSIASEIAVYAETSTLDLPASKIAADAVAQLDGIAAADLAAGVRRVGLGEAGRAALTKVHQKRAGEPVRGVLTGLSALDAVLGALERGQGSVLAGRPSMGKSAVALEIAVNAARAGTGVAYISLEMDGVMLAQRALASLCFDDFNEKPIPYSRIGRGQVSDREIDRLDRASSRLDDLPLVIEQQPGLNVSQIGARLRQLRTAWEAQGQSLGLVVVDHLGLVSASSRYSGDRVREIGEISAGFHALAREADVHVMMLSQLSRQIEQRSDKRPQLHDLRESGEIEQNADVVMGVFREAYYLERSGLNGAEDEARLEAVQNIIEIGVLKNRQGPTGPVRLFADMASNAIRELRNG